MRRRRYKIYVCRGPECGDRRGSRALHDEFVEALRERGLEDRVELAWQSCFGRCTQGPNTLIREILPPDPGADQRFVFAAMPQRRRSHSALYNHLTVQNVGELIDEHVLAGRIVRRLIERPARVAADDGPSGRPPGAEQPGEGERQ